MNEPRYQSERVTLYLGDCLEVLPQIRVGSIDIVLADPPYGINTKSDGMGKLSPWADLCNSAAWYAQWFAECRRVLSSCGLMWSFLNWRSLVTFQKASCDIRWPITSLMVWHKDWIGPGGTIGLRPAYELVAMWAAEAAGILDRGVADVQTFKWCGLKPTGHPAEKPVELCEFLIDRCRSIDSERVVLDPFMGSCSSGLAALRTGGRYIGIELDEEHYKLAERRIRAEEAQAQLGFVELEPVVEDVPDQLQLF